MTNVTMEAPALFSSLASDPDMGELVDLFVSELPDRVGSLQAALDRADFETLGRCAHQLKGAAGSYGFDALTPALKQLEQRVRDRGPEDEVRELLSDVTELCRRVRSGLPQ